MRAHAGEIAPANMEAAHWFGVLQTAGPIAAGHHYTPDASNEKLKKMGDGIALNRAQWCRSATGSERCCLRCYEVNGSGESLIYRDELAERQRVKDAREVSARGVRNDNMR